MKLGVALAGGGLKGLAHIGALAALEELGAKIDYLSGTSSGSIFAACYAMGYTLDEIVERSLKGAALWDEVKDRLKKSALGLSGGQQQRLCIARTIAVSPEIILMDEPTSALDPISTNKMEELMDQLKKQYTVVIVTHNMQQAARISDDTAVFLNGVLVEHSETKTMFTSPQDKRTEDYITGRFG